MKIRGLRWWILGLIIVISIINYLDRGTINYMWFSKKAAPQTEVSANTPLQDEYIGISLPGHLLTSLIHYHGVSGSSMKFIRGGMSTNSTTGIS